jgi:PEP-CTERM motif
MKKILGLGLIGLVAVTAAARADIIPTFIGTSSTGDPFNPNTVWSYNIDITSRQNAVTGDFFTIYDFGSFLAGSVTQPTGWTLTSTYLGTTPAQTIPNDDPSLLNLTWTYSGPTISGNSPEGKGIGPFSVTVFGSPTLPRISNFAAQGTLAAGPNAGSKLANVGDIRVPTPVPEPSTFTLVGLSCGLALIGRAISRRRKS